MWLSIFAIILLALLAYHLAFALIEDMKELFLKAGISSKDLNKKDDSKMYAIYSRTHQRVHTCVCMYTSRAYLLYLYLWLCV